MIDRAAPVRLRRATEAGAGARQSIGTTVFGGMVLASLVGVLFVPPLFVGFELLGESVLRRFRAARDGTAPARRA